MYVCTLQGYRVFDEESETYPALSARIGQAGHPSTHRQAARSGFVWKDSRHSCGQEGLEGQGIAQGVWLHGEQGYRHV